MTTRIFLLPIVLLALMLCGLSGRAADAAPAPQDAPGDLKVEGGSAPPKPAPRPAPAIHGCTLCGEPCAAGQLPCTRMVPMRVTETRYRDCVVTEQVERKEKYTEFQRVPETRKFYRDECWLETVVKTKTITQEQCHVVMNPVERKVKVQLPATVQDDLAGGKAGQTGTGCPKVVLVEEEQVIHCQEPDVVFSKTTCDIDYCVQEPKTRKVECAEDTVWKLKPVEKERTVVKCVPKIVKVPYEVTVCRMVPMPVTCCSKCRSSVQGK